MGATTTKEQPKTCAGCGKEKPAGAFYVASGMRDGRMSKCRDCMVEAQRIFRNREKSGQSSLLRQPPQCSHLTPRPICRPARAVRRAPGCGVAAEARCVHAARHAHLAQRATTVPLAQNRES